MTLPTKSAHHDFIIIINKVQATVPGHKSGDLLSVLPEEHPHSFTDTRVGLLGTDADLLYHKTFGLGGPREWAEPSLLQKSLLQPEGSPP